MHINIWEVLIIQRIQIFSPLIPVMSFVAVNHSYLSTTKNHALCLTGIFSLKQISKPGAISLDKDLSKESKPYTLHSTAI